MEVIEVNFFETQCIYIVIFFAFNSSDCSPEALYILEVATDVTDTMAHYVAKYCPR